jgi:hypothetical protein
MESKFQKSKAQMPICSSLAIKPIETKAKSVVTDAVENGESIQ